MDFKTCNPSIKFNFLQYRYGFWLWCCKKKRGLVWIFHVDEYDWPKIWYPIYLTLIWFSGNAAAVILFTSKDVVALWLVYTQVNLLLLLFITKFGIEAYRDIREIIISTNAEQYVVIEEFLTSPDDIHREFGRRFSKEYRWI